MGFFERMTSGLSRSREKFKQHMNVLLDRGPDLDEEFWDTLEETLILSDIGAAAADEIVETLRSDASRLALPDAYAVLDLLNERIADTFATCETDPFSEDEAVVLFVGINGTGKTTTVGKIAKESTDAGRTVILGSADTFRAAAIEQLEVWAKRADVEMVTRERGADPASVCYDTIERAEKAGADLVLVDTAGRLHTSADLMRELEKVVGVVRKRSSMPVYTVLVIDATTGQNGLQQAKEFDRALDLDGLIVTKLDGSAKGGISLAVSYELGLPVLKIGVGEGIDDLRDFNANDFASALIGDFDERYEQDEAVTAELQVNDAGDSADLVIDAPESDGAFLVEVDDIAFDPESEGDEANAEANADANAEVDAEANDATVEADADAQADEPGQPDRKKHFWERWLG